MNVHQFHPQVAFGDAASNQVLSLQQLLRSMGHTSEIFCEQQPFVFEGKTHPLADYERYASPDNVLLLHYTIHYSENVVAWLRQIPDRKVLIYHNITPSHYFAGVNAPLAEAAERGRRQLRQLAEICDAGWGVSAFNCRELEEHGWSNLAVMPIVFDPERYDVRPSRSVIDAYADERANLLFVGRMAPNKHIEDLILTFFHLKRYVRPEARLLLVGAHGGMARYVDFLERVVEELELEDVNMPGHVGHAELVAYYRCADCYLSMSEHEGFGVPFLEAMHFGLPIVAYKAAAVSETLGESGILVKEKDFPAIAELIGLLIEDQDLRERLTRGQSVRLRDFLPGRARDRLQRLLGEVWPR
jgi:glycosyltransferase involved in cell wall biosynthesis